MPSEIELCESLTVSVCGSVASSHAPAGSLRRAITAARLAVYHAAYWKPAKLTIAFCWYEALLTRPSNDTKYSAAGSSWVSPRTVTTGAAAAGAAATHASAHARTD